MIMELLPYTEADAILETQTHTHTVTHTLTYLHPKCRRSVITRDRSFDFFPLSIIHFY